MPPQQEKITSMFSIDFPKSFTVARCDIQAQNSGHLHNDNSEIH